MTIENLYKTPWPWFGGKADAAEAVWSAIGDCEHYVEPFAGSLAVLLRRPHPCNRTYYSETVNDLDGLLVNAWRSIQMSPDAMADAASWPVSEADMHARHLALVKWRAERQLEHLMGDPTWHDPVMAGWWAWGQSCWIGSGWCSGTGPWIVDGDGRITKRGGADGVGRNRPHLSDDGRGVNRPQTREPGVDRKRPHLGDDGCGVNRPQTREPGVDLKRPDISSDGKGVNRPQTREPGTEGDRHEYHQMTMPELRRWFRFLSARLRHVRIINGDWRRAVTGGAAMTLSVRKNEAGSVGIFLDPPYTDVRTDGLYAHDSLTVAHDVREWAAKAGANSKWRIVLAGFDGEHDDLCKIGWRVVEWYRAGFLRGGMGNTAGTDEDGATKHQQHKERLWLSPGCLEAAKPADQLALFGGAA